jgi:hypothetical protein
MVERVKREIRYLRSFQHPHIIKLYEIITTPTDILLVMEYAGNELFNYIVDRGRMAEDEARYANLDHPTCLTGNSFSRLSVDLNIVIERELYTEVNYTL